MMRTKEMQRWRALNLTRNQGGLELWRQIKEASLHMGYFAADHCRHLLILSVFAFKVSELAVRGMPNSDKSVRI